MYETPFDIPDMSYDQALEALHGALRLGIQPMLETVVDMLAELGNPDRSYRSLQIAGTNGKSSTARYTAAILAEHGLRAGLYTSPELVSYNERIEVGGGPIEKGAFARGISAAIAAGRRVNARREAAGDRPYDITEFDIITVAAAFLFAECEIDVAVLECGMGGRWDATSAFDSIETVCVTGIGLDHTRVLGDTLEKIAAEKAAIIKPGRSCVLGVGTATPDGVEDVFLSQCEAAGVTPTLLRPARLQDAEGEVSPGVPRVHPDLPLASYEILQTPGRIGGSLVLTVTTPRASYPELGALKPAYQAANIACAVTLAEQFLGRALDYARVEEAVVSCPTPGRFDVVRPEPLALVDACHNPQSVAAFLTAVRDVEPKVENRPLLLCAALADKDVDQMVALVATEFPEVAVCRTSSPRAMPAETLAEVFEGVGKTPVAVYPDVASAVNALADTAFVACGSITLAGEVAGLLRRTYLPTT